MAHITCNFGSDTLGLACSIEVVLPQVTNRLIGIKTAKAGALPPVLYLLHGLSDDQTIWMRRTSIERYASEYGIAVVMPSVARSYYRNVNSCMRYWDFISEELPGIVTGMFKVSGAREDTFAAGLSMGGYGALKLALNCPDRFAACASLSGAFEPDTWMRDCGRLEEADFIFQSAEHIKNTEDDLPAMAEKLAASGKKAPELFIRCGAEDYFINVNRKYNEMLTRLGYNVNYSERPGGHSWENWDMWIQDVLKWLPIRKEKECGNAAGDLEEQK